MIRMPTIFASIVMLTQLSVQARAEEALLIEAPQAEWDTISELEAFELGYDRFSSGFSERDLRREQRDFYKVDRMQRSAGTTTNSCRVGAVDWPCSRRPKISLYESSTQMVIDGALPPPVPWGVMNVDMKKALDAEFSESQIQEVEYGADVRYEHEPTSPAKPLRVPAFDESVVEAGLRNEWWYPIEDFTYFAPANRVLYGDRVFALIAAASQDHGTECQGICPIYLNRQLGKFSVYEMCSRRKIGDVSSPSVYCTPVAFTVSGENWLRTTLVHGLGIDEGRGDGPLEMFRCLTALSTLEAAHRLETFFRGEMNAEVRIANGNGFSNVIAVAWRDLPSTVASNRWEVVYFDFWIRPSDTPVRNLVTNVHYRIPVYRLSDTRPSSLNDGARPKDKIVRLYEQHVRTSLTQAIVPAECSADPTDVDY